MSTVNGKSILLIISGGIAAYKSLELIRLLKKSGAHVRCVLTKGGAQFVTPLSVSALSENEVFTDLWSLKDETEMGHIRLSREADLIVIAPASADLLAKMTHGLTDDLASATLLAANKPILTAPAMNHQMWLNPATQVNIKSLKQRGISFIGPDEGDMACGEYGPGRMSEPAAILEAIQNHFSDRPLKGLKALVTSGPTYEPIDPVRFLGNRSSGKQGHAIAAALAQAGADVSLISGPTALADPAGVHITKIETAAEMHDAAQNALPCDIAICAAAVSDWRASTAAAQKIKKSGSAPPSLNLEENPDILQMLASHKKRPKLVIGFAAETENLKQNARAKLSKKGCDWIIANLVGTQEQTTFGADDNHVHLLTDQETQDWPLASKAEIAARLVQKIQTHFNR